MTEYELSDLINGISSNIVQGQAVYLTMITAYLAVAYSVGSKLTRFQVSFVNFVYILFGLVGLQSQLYNIDQVYYWGAQLMELRGKPPTPAENVSAWLFIFVRLVMLIGSLLFMWQVRHPKTK
jgi:hypothetical protein